jgi:hypothetical protein
MSLSALRPHFVLKNGMWLCRSRYILGGGFVAGAGITPRAAYKAWRLAL